MKLFKNLGARLARSIVVAATSVAITVSAVLPAGAATHTWIGVNGGGWSDPNNWNLGSVPVSDASTVVQINAVDPLSFTSTNDLPENPFVLNGLNLNNGSTGPVAVSTNNPFQMAGAGAAINLQGTGATSIASSSGGVIFDVANPFAINGVAGAGGLTIGNANDSTVFTGAGAVTVNFATAGNAGAPNLLLGNTQGWTGMLDIQGGYVKALRTGGDLFGNATVLNVAAGATYDFSNNAETFGGLSGAGTIVLGTAGMQFVAAGDRTWTGSIGGTGGVDQSGGGLFVLGGTNSYSGVTLAANGIIRAGSANALSPNSEVRIIAGQGTLDLNGFTQTIAGLSGDRLDSVISLGAGTLTINGSGAGVRTFNGALGGTGNLVIGGTATQNITGVSTYTGSTTVNGGTLRVNPLGLQASSGTTVGADGTLDLNAPTDMTWAAPLSGTGNLVKSGAGVVTFASPVGMAPASLAVNGGTLRLDHSANNAAKFAGNPPLMLGSATLEVLGNGAAATNVTFDGTALTGGGHVRAVAGNNQNATVHLGALTRSIGSTVNFRPVNTGSGVGAITTTTNNGSTGIIGGYAVVNGTDWAASGTGAGPFNVAPLAAGGYTGNTWSAGTHTDVTSSFTVPSAGATGSVRFNANAAATLTLTGTDSITSGGILVTPNVGANTTTITTGTLTAPANQELLIHQHNTAGNLVISSVIGNTPGTAVVRTAATLGTGRTITLPSTAGLFPGMLITAGTNIPGNLNAHVVSVDSPTQITISFKTDVTTNPGSAPVAGTDVPITFTPGTYVSKNGPGTVVLGANNTFTGSIILNEGTLSATTAAQLGATATGASSSVIFNGGTLRLTGAFSTSNGLQPYIFGPGGGTIEVANVGQRHTKQGNTLSGSGTLTKTGPGELSIGSNASIFNGQVVVNQGILLFQSNQFQQAQGVTVNPGGQYQINDDAANGNFNIVAGGVMSLSGNGPVGSTTPGAFALTDQAPNGGAPGGPGSNFNSNVHLAADATIGVYNGNGGRVSELRFNNPVTGPGNLLKVGPGVLRLSNASNSYGNGAGFTTISNGTIRILGGDNRLPTGTTLQFGQVGSTNDGTFDLNGLNQTVAGLTTVGAATGHQVINSSGAVAVPTLTVNYNGGSPQTFGGLLGGTGSAASLNLVKAGSGTLTLSRDNVYTGSTTVSAGTLRVVTNNVARPYAVADGAELSVVNEVPSSAFTMSTLALGTAGASNLGFELTAGKATFAMINVLDPNGLTANGTVNVSLSSAQSLTLGAIPLIKYSGSIGGAGFAAFSGGTLQLPSRVIGSLVNNVGNSSIDLNVTGVDFVKWTGATNGNWNINSTQNWKLNSNSAPTTYLENPAPGDTVVFDDSATGTHTVNLTTTLTPSAVTVDTGAPGYVFTGPGKITGPTTLTKLGTGTLRLETNNDYTGATTVNTGTLQVGNGGTAGTLGTGELIDNGSVVFDRSDDLTFGNAISGTGNLTKSGAGKLSVNGAYTLGGTTTINAGTLALSSGTTAGNFTGAGALNKFGPGILVLTGNVAPAAGTTIDGGTLQIGDGGASGSLSGNTTVAGGANLAFNRSDDVTYAGNLSGAGGLLKNGVGKVSLTGTIGYSGPTAVNEGTLEYASGSDVTLNAVVSGTGTIVKSGAGTLNLLSNNSFTGTLNIDQGTVYVDDLGAGGDLRASSVVINPGGTFIFGSGINNPDLAEGDNGTFITINGGEFVHRTGEVWSGTRLTNNGTFRFLGIGAGVGANSNATSGPFVGYQLESGLIVAENVGTGTGTLTGNITKITPGTVSVSGRVSVAAASTIAIQEGVLAFETGNVPTTGAGGITLGNFSTTGTLRVTGTGSGTIARTIDVPGPGAIDVTDAAGTLVVTGSITGGGTLAKTGAGTLAMAPPSSFGGTTAVQGGTLRMTPGSAGGAFTVGNNATLALDHRGSPGNVALPSLTLESTGSTIAFELDTAGNPGAPMLSVINPGGLVLNPGTHTLVVNNSQPLAAGQFTLIDYDGAAITSGFTLAALPARATGGLVYNTGNTSIDLNLTGVDSTVWNGNVNGNWDVGTAANVGGTNNFKLASNAAATNFIVGDRVTFDDSATGVKTVNLTTALQPASINVNNNGGDYTFQGPGSITGSTGLIKDGSSALTLLTDNTYTGATTVNGGTVNIGNGGTTGSIAGPLAVNGGAVVNFNRSTDSTLGGVISGFGNINKAGAGTLTLTAANPFAGTLTVDGGTVVVDDLGAGGDLNAVSIVVNNGGKFVLGENGNADLPDSTIFTVNTGGTVDIMQGENFGGIVLKGGTVRMASSTRTGTNMTATGVGGFILESGSILTDFSGPANGGLLAGTTFLDKNTPGTVTLGNGVAINVAVTVNVNEGVLSMGAASVPASGTGAVNVGGGSTAGTLQINDAGSASSTRAFFVNSGGGIFDVTNAAGSLTVAGDLSGSGTLTKTGAGTLTVGSAATFNGPAVVNGGTLNVTGNLAAATSITVNATGAFQAGATQTIRNLTVNPGGTGRVAVGAAKALTVGDGTATYADTASSHLNLAGGSFDVTNNALIVDYAAGSNAAAFAAVRSKVIAGYNAGTWTGAGITSSTAAATPSSHGVGYALASDVLGPTGGAFVGGTADGDAVLARYTLLGDATLDGTVNFNDLVKLAQNYNVTDGSRVWFTGDFTYDGNVDFNDLVKLAQNYNTSLPTEPIPGAGDGFGADLAAAFAAVPEPGTLSLLALAACGLAVRRRRN